jgi:uracil-DNA glycosylase
VNWAEYREKWSGCELCTLFETRKQVVLERGNGTLYLPCDIVFCGEAPGPSEDIIGKPFKGPAGQLLDRILRMVGLDEFKYAFTNLICCIPLDPTTGGKIGEPPVFAVHACAQRMKEFMALAKPKLVVCVGAQASNWVRKKAIEYGLKGVGVVDLTHPAAILRTHEAGQELMIRKQVVVLRNAIQELKESGRIQAKASDQFV